MNEAPSLLNQAVTGASSAHVNMAEHAMHSYTTGAARPVEALMSAEIWARFAAGTGGPAEMRMLTVVLLARSNFEDGRGASHNAEWYRSEARLRLGDLAATGDEEAAAMLIELADTFGTSGDREDEHAATAHTFNVNITAAASGNLAALSSLYDAAMQTLNNSHCDQLEALTAAELYSRLGAAAGDIKHVRRLAEALLLRAEYELNGGWSAIADSAISEAAVLLSILVENGESEMETSLETIVNGASSNALVDAVRQRPAILNFIAPIGTC